jgi:hypothetical protein
MINKNYDKKNVEWKEYFAFAFSLISLFISWCTYNKLIQTNQAQIVIPQNEVKLLSVGPPCQNEQNYSCDVINPTIKNIGKAIAEDVNIKLFGCFPDGQVIYNNLHCGKYWDTNLIGNLAPGEIGNYGDAYIYHTSTTTCGSTGSLVGRQIILIFQLSYKDTLTKKVQFNFSFFQYQVGLTRNIDGGSVLKFLVYDDFQKMCPWISNDLKIAEAGRELLDYVDIRCDKKSIKQLIHPSYFPQDYINPVSVEDSLKLIGFK